MPKKIIITILVSLLAGVLGIIYALPSFIDKESIKTQLASSFKNLTGLDLEIQGEVKVIRFPSPHVVVNSLYVHNARGASSPFLLTVRLAEIWPTYHSIMKKNVGISKINFSGVDIEMEKLKNDQMNWNDSSVQTSSPEGVAGLSNGTNAGLTGTTMTVNDGYIHYLDVANGISQEYKDISLSFLNGGDNSKSTLGMAFTYRDKNIKINGDMGSIPHALSVGEVPANLNIISGKSTLIYSGNAGYRDNNLIVNGSVKLSTDDFVTWVSTFSGSAEDKPILGVNYKLLPLEAKSDITSEKGKIIFPNLTMEGAIVKGGARVELTPPYGIDIKGDINSLDLETLFASRLFALKEMVDPLAETKAANKEATFIVVPKTFLNALNLSGDIKFSDVLYNQQHIQDAHIEFDMAEGEMTIAQSTAILPGNTHAFFTGIGKEGFDGFALEGELDANGDNFIEAMKILKASGAALPPEDFKRFKFKGNTIFSRKEMRMSEMAARIENMAFLGGFIATFGDHIKLNAALRVGGINFDHFADVWGLKRWRNSFTESAAPDAKNENFMGRWLKHLEYDAIIKVTLEQYILNEMPRDRGELKIDATANKITLKDIKTNYNGSQIAGSIGIDVTNPLPHVDVKLTTDIFDMETFFTKDGKRAPDEKGAAPQQVAAVASPPAAPQPGEAAPRPAITIPAQPQSAIVPSQAPAPIIDPVTLIPHWSHDQFDFHWMEYINLTFHLKFGQYKYGRVSGQSVDVLGAVENRALSIEALTGYLLNAQVAAKINISAGKIPSASLAANVTSLDPVQLVPFFPLIDGMTGRYNLSLKLDTSGIDMYSWMSSLEGSVGLGGSDVNIHGFNLPGVIRSVSYVRTVADILNVVKRAFPGGDTQFNNIEGQWTLAGGVLKTSNTKMSNTQADGVLTSQVDLLNWQMLTNINLALKILDPAHPPGMIITFNGSLAKPETALDTRSLERYVTNKTSERMLQEYGNQ